MRSPGPTAGALGAGADGGALTYGSVCSGIEAASVAWSPLGWRPSFYSEIEAFPRAVLKHHHPEVPLHGDFTTIRSGEYQPIDLLVGGTPCQSFSVAGLRGGLDDDRGNLALEYLRLADRLRPRWLVWENVPGVLSSNGGRDFGAILGGMVELGYGIAYRVLDAQFFGVAQRRRRVFVVGYLGDWRRAAAVLFERHGLSGHPAPRREAGQSAPTIPSRSPAGGGLGTDFDCDGGLIAGTIGTTSGDWSRDNIGKSLVATPILDGAKGRTDNRGSRDGSALGEPGDPMFTLREGSGHAVAYSIMPQNSGKDYKAREVQVAQPVMAGGPVGGNQGGDYIVQPTAHPPAIAFALRGREGGAMPEVGGEVSNALRTPGGGASVPMIAGTVRSHTRPGSNEVGSVVATSAVRRLTPRECERLQGFPDDYTLIPWRKGMAPDGPRYKALGNSMAVPVMAWIGRRIAAVEALAIQARAA